jgi:hypothetical protein
VRRRSSWPSCGSGGTATAWRSGRTLSRSSRTAWGDRTTAQPAAG